MNIQEKLNHELNELIKNQQVKMKVAKFWFIIITILLIITFYFAYRLKLYYRFS